MNCAVRLAPHAASEKSPVRGIDVRVSRMRSGMLTVVYSLRGDIERVRVPPLREPRIADRLWEHTCCELFVRCDGTLAYHEFNFSPSGEWAVYAFARYREGAPLVDEALNPHTGVYSSEQSLEVTASVALGRLSTVHEHAKLSLALSAVIEAHDGAHSYWALVHAPGKPDFHHPRAFALHLDELRD